PTDDEVATELGMNRDQLNELLRGATVPVSLESPVGEDENDVLATMLPDQDAVDPEEHALHNALKEEASHALEETLTNRERLVLQLRYGLDNGTAYPLEAIGGQLGLTRERVRQIENEAVRKLRTSAAMVHLRDFH